MLSRSGLGHNCVDDHLDELILRTNLAVLLRALEYLTRYHTKFG